MFTVPSFIILPMAPWYYGFELVILRLLEIGSATDCVICTDVNAAEFDTLTGTSLVYMINAEKKATQSDKIVL